MAADGFEGSSNGDLTYASHSAAADFAGATSPIVRRRHERWPDEERDRITAESFEPGSTISAVARRNGVSLGLLHYWRRVARKSGRVEELRFVPVTVEDRIVSEPGGTIEIVLGDARILVDGEVNVARLRSVLIAVRA